MLDEKRPASKRRPTYLPVILTKAEAEKQLRLNEPLKGHTKTTKAAKLTKALARPKAGCPRPMHASRDYFHFVSLAVFAIFVRPS